MLPAAGRVDTASLVAAFLIQLLQFVILWAIAGMGGSLLTLVVLAAFGLVRMSILGLTGLVIIYAVLSWVQTQSMAADFLERLVMPLLAPIRRVVPLTGGIDLSPLVLLVLLQIAGIVLGNVQAAVLVAL